MPRRHGALPDRIRNHSRRLKIPIPKGLASTYTLELRRTTQQIRAFLVERHGIRWAGPRRVERTLGAGEIKEEPPLVRDGQRVGFELQSGLRLDRLILIRAFAALHCIFCHRRRNRFAKVVANRRVHFSRVSPRCRSADGSRLDDLHEAVGIRSDREIRNGVVIGVFCRTCQCCFGSICVGR